MVLLFFCVLQWQLYIFIYPRIAEGVQVFCSRSDIKSHCLLTTKKTEIIGGVKKPQRRRDIYRYRQRTTNKILNETSLSDTARHKIYKNGKIEAIPSIRHKENNSIILRPMTSHHMPPKYVKVQVKNFVNKTVKQRPKLKSTKLVKLETEERTNQRQGFETQQWTYRKSAKRNGKPFKLVSKDKQEQIKKLRLNGRKQKKRHKPNSNNKRDRFLVVGYNHGEPDNCFGEACHLNRIRKRETFRLRFEQRSRCSIQNCLHLKRKEKIIIYHFAV